MLVSVTDEGPGIKPADLERMFEKFYQRRPRRRAQDRHRPRPVDRRGPGRGDGRHASGRKARRSSGAARASSSRCRRSKRAKSPRRPHERRARPDRRRRTADPALPASRRWRPRAMRCCTPRPAARRCGSIANSAPDLIVLDLGLPDMDGKDVIERARSFAAAPIVVLSARDREAEKIAALDLGADDLRREAVRHRRDCWRACAPPCATRAAGASAEDARRGRRPDDRHGEAAGDPRRRRDQADAARIRRCCARSPAIPAG